MRRLIGCGLMAFFSWLSFSRAQEQGYTFTTIAGSSSIGNVDGVGTAARFYDPIGIASDKEGNFYVVDARSATVRKISPDAKVSTLAGMAGNFGNADGLGSSARFSSPSGVAVGGDGVIYVADTGNNAIRQITPDGVVRTLAGGQSGAADGVGNGVGFRSPSSLAVDSGGTIYVADKFNHTIRKIDRLGLVTTLAGQPGLAGSANGVGKDARFKEPSGIVADMSGNLYVADTGNSIIRKISQDGNVTTIAGLAGVTGQTDGVGAAARFFNPFGLAIDGSGTVYVADTINSVVRKITPAGLVSTLAGGFFGLRSLTVDSTTGAIFVADAGSHVVKKVSPAGVVTVFAGRNVSTGSRDGIGTDALFSWPQDLAMDGAGNLFVADANGAAIRKIAPNGYVTTWAGSLGYHRSADGFGTGAGFGSPFALKIDSLGYMWVADFGLNSIRKIDATGEVTTFAGKAEVAGSVDGVGTLAQFNGPAGIALDKSGVIFVSDSRNNTIRRIDTKGVVTTPFGVGGIFFSGYVNGFGNAARFSTPAGLVFDRAGNLYVADMNNHAIRKISPAGEVSTVAGNPAAFGGLDGPGTSATFYFPSGLAMDSDENLFVADRGSHTVRKISPDGMVVTIGGVNGTAGYADGTGAAALFNGPTGIAVDKFGNIYVSEMENNTVRKGIVVGAKGPTFVMQPTSSRVGAGTSVTFTVSAVGPPAPIYQWERRAADANAFAPIVDGSGFSGATTATLIVSSVGTTMNGDQFRCVADNSILPLATSKAATLTVVPPPVFTSANQTTFTVGAPGAFKVVGKDALAYEIVSGRLPAWATFDANTGSISGTPTDLTGAPFSLVIRAVNEAVTASIQTFILNVSPGPLFISQPQDQIVNVGSTAIFSASVAGLAPLSYKWLKETGGLLGVNSSGGTTATLIFDNVKASDAGSFALLVRGPQASALSDSASLVVVTPPTISAQPMSQRVTPGARVVFNVAATSATPISFQWYFNGQMIPGATASIYGIAAADVAWAGQYTVRVLDANTSTLSQPAILNVISSEKTSGFGSEVESDIVHVNGTVYDQVLLGGNMVNVSADPGQVVRISCIDLSDDIVQIEFSGAGTLNLRLDDASGPAAPVKYNQSVNYMKGHPTISISDADQTTNVSVFSVGRVTAINQAIFRQGLSYDGVADIGSITITSANGKFGGVFTGNASYFDTKGVVGIYAPDVQFTGPIVVGNISGADLARATIIVGAAGEVRVAGGDMAQMNQQPVQIKGVGKLSFTAGANSHGVLQPAKQNRARLLENGINVTDKIVVNPVP